MKWGMSFCPRPLMVMAAALLSLLGVRAMQVIAQQAPRTSGTHGTSAVVGAQSLVRRSEGGAFFRRAEQERERSLADEGCSDDEEGQLFVDSVITNLKYPIGGCYESSSITNSSTSEYSSYALGGGLPTKGQSWIYATSSGVWVIGIVEEIDKVTGEVASLETVCSSNNDQADELSGPTDSQLNGVWRCSYFEAGKTNRVEADFKGIECGCAGRSISAQSSGGGSFSSTAIAITTLAALVVLLVLVCLCLLHLKKQKAQTQDADSPSKEDPLGSKEKALAPKEDTLAHAEEALAPTQDALAPGGDPLAFIEEDAPAPAGDPFTSTEEDTLASEEGALAV